MIMPNSKWLYLTMKEVFCHCEVISELFLFSLCEISHKRYLPLLYVPALSYVPMPPRSGILFLFFPSLEDWYWLQVIIEIDSLTSVK
jgi:hypothetical protein